MADEEIRMTLRLPVQLRDRISAAAAVRNRSMNGEIVARLESRIEPDEQDGSFRIWLPHRLLERILHQAEQNEEDPNLLIVGALKEHFPETGSALDALRTARQKMEEELLKSSDSEMRKYAEHSIRQIDEMIAIASDAAEEKRAKNAQPLPWRHST
ncbi:Arc family DNA-binding protein [Jiella pacifica]|uniref:Arc family DNA-binding protein n=1 Tax=Jiella pacifica TaxID=2696469 RepID=A0A6N9TF16_9HYPH|nr:Arc family DNA-binding protein [Jiella pacifica]NDW07458.1 Arc family DNA-binding protein [Jiella pacifica]